MKYSCDVIRDLIPLYIDDVASPSSRQMVEEHLAECADCQGLLSQMKNEEVEKAITDEKENVIAGQRRLFKRRSAVIGSVIAGIFMIPILICLIVNLASGSGLNWFFIVLSALLVAASLSIVPLMVPENKGLWTLGSFIVSLLLLFGVCCLYTGGKWFFVASTAVLFGLSVVFLPFVGKSGLFPASLESRRGLVIMATDTVLFVLMMLAIGLHSKASNFFPVASAVSVPLVGLAWALFAVTQYLRQRKPKQDPPAQSAHSNPGPFRKQEEPRRRLPVWEIVLLALGSPIWLALLITAFAVLLSVYIVIWAVIVSLWAAEVSCIVGAFGSIALGTWSLFQGSFLRGIVMFCASLVLAGLSIFLFFCCRAATKGALVLTKNIAKWIQSLILRKGNAE